MRISDWSSDVCSSDLVMHRVAQAADNGTIGQWRAIALIFDRPQAGAESTRSGIEIDTQPGRLKRPCRRMQAAIAIDQQRAAVEHQFVLTTDAIDRKSVV